jgi:hypothetical protein
MRMQPDSMLVGEFDNLAMRYDRCIPISATVLDTTPDYATTQLQRNVTYVSTYKNCTSGPSR